VLLQLAGQARRHRLLDAASRVMFWVEYDAVKAAGSHVSSAADAAAGTDGSLSPRAGAAAGVAASGSGGHPPSSVAALVGAPGGIGAAAAEGIAPPKPRSKKRQEEEAEAAARERAAVAAQQQLLERLAAAHRQAARVSRDGSSLAARFAPPARARHTSVRLRVFRADAAAAAVTAAQLRNACDSFGGSAVAVTIGGAVGTSAAGQRGTAGLALAPAHRNSSWSGGGSSSNGLAPATPKVAAVPVKPQLLTFAPRRQPWASIRPTQRPIQQHAALPMPRPQPLLLPSGGGAAARVGGGLVEPGLSPAAAAALPPEAAAAAAAAAGTGSVGPSGRLLSGGIVAAARAVAARDVLLANVPRAAAYSVVSDHNRSGRHEVRCRKELRGACRRHQASFEALAATQQTLMTVCVRVCCVCLACRTATRTRPAAQTSTTATRQRWVLVGRRVAWCVRLAANPAFRVCLTAPPSPSLSRRGVAEEEAEAAGTASWRR
jgi:hypothetical protein